MCYIFVGGGGSVTECMTLKNDQKVSGSVPEVKVKIVFFTEC